ncbi:MAG: N-formylglutamate amidohydrolase [Clostridia bacterium]|nr:N-formylglutamate amidohydrolase [Clostridia bacterium]
MQKVIFHVPHDGTAMPSELMSSVCVPMEVFNFYQEKMRDNDVQKMVPLGYESVCFNVSRLLCDVERFIGEGEPMEKFGMGFCYEKVYDGTVIKVVTPQLKEATEKYYWAHHRQMDGLAERYRKGLFLIDLHSFSDDIVVNCNETAPFSDICLGYEEKYCGRGFVQLVDDIFRKAGYSVSHNVPYQGSFVPNAALNDGSIVCSSMMVEINRRLYRPCGITDECEIVRLRTLLKQVAHEAESYSGKAAGG